MTLKNDAFDFIYELLCDYSMDHMDDFTGFEQKMLKSIREQFSYVHHLIEKR